MSDRLILKTCNVQPVHEILRCAVKFKGIETSYQTLHDGPPQFIDHGNAIVGLHNIIAHLEDRFPAPPLLLGDAMARSRQRMIFWQIVERAQRNEIAELLEEFSPYVINALLTRTFLTGENPTIVDIAVAALCINGPSPYAEFRHVITEFCGQQMEVA
jgi:glutathione S-transferase